MRGWGVRLGAVSRKVGAEGGSREIPGYLRVKDDGKVEVRSEYICAERSWSCAVKFCLRMGPDVPVVSERHGKSWIKIW